MKKSEEFLKDAVEKAKGKEIGSKTNMPPTSPELAIEVLVKELLGKDFERNMIVSGKFGTYEQDITYFVYRILRKYADKKIRLFDDGFWFFIVLTGFNLLACLLIYLR